jgi:hypothetical protein
MADVSVFGRKVNPWVAGAVGIGGAGVAWLAWKQHKASASSASAIDPLTGLPASQDNAIDPLTGEAYLAEAQEYGSVQAAEQAVAGESAIDYSGAYDTGSGLVGTSAGTSLVPSTVVQGTTYASNAAWAQAVEAGLTDIGYSSTDVAAALGRYLSNLSETPAQAGIVQAAIAEYGPPPVGSFQVILAPSTGTGTTTTGTGTGTKAPADVTVPNVVGQKAGTAHNELVRAGLTVSNRPNSNYTVTATTPKGGTRVPKGRSVDITAKP